MTTTTHFASKTGMNGAEAEMLSAACQEVFGTSYREVRRMMEGGYVPTLRTYKGKDYKAHNHAVSVIREHLDNRQWPHFSDGKCCNY